MISKNDDIVRNIEKGIKHLEDAIHLLRSEADIFYNLDDNQRGNIRHGSAYSLSLQVDSLISATSHLAKALKK